MKTKKCTKCGEVKPVSEFYKDKKHKDGLYGWCKECVKAYNKKRYDANPEKRKAAVKKHRDANPERVWAQRTLGGHRRKGYEIQITNDELTEIAKQVKTCPICGCEFAWGPKGKSGKIQPNSPTLDRINNGQIITKETIQIICHQCNTTKGARTMKELIVWCEMVFKKFKGEKKK